LELYHHLICVNGLDIATGKEEREANEFAKRILKERSKLMTASTTLST
jgi:Zn-dependent peptidase ImmA (M78 family)